MLVAVKQPNLTNILQTSLVLYSSISIVFHSMLLGEKLIPD